MTDSDTLRVRLERVLEHLASGAIPSGPSGDNAASADASGMPAEAADDHVTVLAALADEIGNAADRTEEILSAHPFTAIIAALVLGAAIGRMTAE